MGRMRHGYGVGRAEAAEPSDRMTTERRWWRSPRELLIAAISLAVVGFTGGLLVSAFLLFPSQGGAGDLVRIPELVGRSGEDARSLLERSGLEYVEATSVHHPEAAAGLVLAQAPLPGQMARPGAPVRVTLSLGSRERPVPDVAGLSRRQAEIVLERAGFRTDAAFIDADAPVGQVVGSDPSPGTAVELPGAVRLLVSAGPPRVEVPDLVSRSVPESEAMLQRLGLRLGSVERDWASEAAPGTVLRQAPGAGTVVDRGTEIRVTVASVPPESEDTGPGPGSGDAPRF